MHEHAHASDDQWHNKECSDNIVVEDFVGITDKENTKRQNHKERDK